MKLLVAAFLCQLNAQNSIHVSYDFSAKHLEANVMIEGKVTKKTGGKYFELSRAEIIKNETIRNLAVFSKFNLKEITSATVFHIEGKDLTTLAVVKYLDSQNKIVGASALIGMAAAVCQ